MNRLDNSLLHSSLFFGMLLLLCTYSSISAQTCYSNLLEAVQQAKEKGNYDIAINLLKETSCSDLTTSEQNNIQSFLNTLNEEYIAALEVQHLQDQKIVQAIYFYHNKLALAAKTIDGKIKYGFINRNGDPVIDYLYDEAILFDEDIAYAKVKRNKKYYYLDTLGNEYLLAESVQEMTRETQVLDLSRQGLKELPERLRIYTQLKILNLYDNEFYMLPDWIGELNYLEEIYLGYNMFNEIPPSVLDLRSLTKLDLYDNEITSIPSDITKLKPLQYLSLSFNSIEALPQEISELKDLKKLDLINTPLAQKKEANDQLNQWLPNCIINW